MSIREIAGSRLRFRLTAVPAAASYPNAIDFSSFEVIAGGEAARLAAVGISLQGQPDCLFLLPAGVGSYGAINVVNRQPGGVFLFGPPPKAGCSISLTILGENCVVAMPDFSLQRLGLHQLALRSDDQFFYFGARSTCVGASVEMHGAGRSIVIGDDCMLSGGIWIRNFDMHLMFDIATGQQVNKAPVDTVVERRVWIGQDASLLAATRIGQGAIVGTRALVLGEVPACSAVAGSPAKVVRRGVGWTRSSDVIAPDVVAAFAELDFEPPAPLTAISTFTPCEGGCMPGVAECSGLCADAWTTLPAL